MSRLHQLVLILSLILLSWLGFMIVHETGHVIGAWGTGGTVLRVVLHPLVISRTDVWPNPHPLAEVWAGAVLGVLLPLAAWGLARLVRMPGAYLLRFFAGFCLIANGMYLSVGTLDRAGDPFELIEHGAAAWQMILFGILTVPPGLYLWHRQGIHFGLGAAQEKVSARAAYAALGLLVFVVIAEILSGAPS